MMAFNYPGAYSFYRPRPQPANYACYPDAYESSGDSYANTLFAPPFIRRRPSPPPATYVPRNVSPNDYIRALAEEQAARSALSEAIQREQAARARRERAEAEARARAQEEARRKAIENEYKRRARPQTIYGYPFGYDGYYDDEEEEQETASPFDAYFYPSASLRRTPTPTHRRAHSQVHPQAQAQPQRASSQTRECPHVRQRSPMRSPLVPSDDEKVSSSPKSERITIPITSPGEPQPAPDRHTSPTPRAEAAQRIPEATQEQIDAAAKIQAAYRSHAARTSALDQIDSIRARLDELRSGFTFPTELDFEEDAASYLTSYPLDRDPVKPAPKTEEDAMELEEELVEPPRPKLAYTARNAPVHGHEDALLKLLQALDTIESGGDVSVREKRRAVVREVEEELKKVDEDVRLRWKAVLEGLSAEPAEKDVQAVEEKEVEQGLVVEESVPETTQEEKMDVEASEPITSSSTATSEEAMDVEPSSIPTSSPAPSSDAIVTEPDDDETNSTMSASIESSASETQFHPTTASEPIIEEVESSDSEEGDLSTLPHPLSVSLPTHVGVESTPPSPSSSRDRDIETQLDDDSLPHPSIKRYDSDVPAVVVDRTPQSSLDDEDEVFNDVEEGPIEDADADLVHVEVQSEPEPQSKTDLDKSSEDSEFVML